MDGSKFMDGVDSRNVVYTRRSWMPMTPKSPRSSCRMIFAFEYLCLKLRVVLEF
jgi:hypothetical protein